MLGEGAADNPILLLGLGGKTPGLSPAPPFLWQSCEVNVSGGKRSVCGQASEELSLLFSRQLSDFGAAENIISMQELANQSSGKDNPKHASF